VCGFAFLFGSCVGDSLDKEMEKVTRFVPCDVGTSKVRCNIPYSYKRQVDPEPPSNATSIAGLGIMSCCYQHQQTCHFRLLVMSVAGPVMCALLVIYIFFVILCICLVVVTILYATASVPR
jgi:hypothetical protein